MIHKDNVSTRLLYIVTYLYYALISGGNLGNVTRNRTENRGKNLYSPQKHVYVESICM